MIFKYDSENTAHVSLVPPGLRAKNGDLITISNGRIRILLSEDFIRDSEERDAVLEKIGKDCMRVIIKAIRTQVPNGADRITIVKLLNPVFTLLGDGFIQDARDMANAEATTAVFTTARKNFVLSEIDKALLIIN